MKVRVKTNVASRFGATISTSFFGEVSFDSQGFSVFETEKEEQEILGNIEYFDSIGLEVEIGKVSSEIHTATETKPVETGAEKEIAGDVKTDLADTNVSTKTELTGDEQEQNGDSLEDSGLEGKSENEFSEEDQLTDEQILSSLNSKKVAELKEWAADLNLDMSSCKVKDDYVNLIFEHIKN